MLQKKRTPLMKLKVVHSLRGRLRIHARALHYLETMEEELIERVESHTAIHKVSFSTVSGNLLVHYDANEIRQDDVLEIIETNLGIFSLLAHQKEREARSQLTVQERRIQNESVRSFLNRVGFTAAALVVLGLKGYGKTQQGNLLKRFTNPAALLSLGLSTSIFKSGVDSLKDARRPNADTLTMTAILTAIVTGRSMSALMTILLSDIAELMTAYTIEQTRAAISDMVGTGDEDVMKVMEDGSLQLVSIQEIVQGDVISVQTGEKINVDGVVLNGHAFIDQSAITGEYFPAHRKVGDTVFAGTVVKSGQIHVRTEKVGEDTTVSRIVHLVEDAAGKKAQIQTYADRFSAQLIPLNFALAALVYLTTRNVTRALNMMIIDYSCGVRLSTATALSASIHNAARNGVLIKGGNYIEMMTEADSIVLDKTGTMTEGRPRVLSVITHNGATEQELLELAGAAEEDSSHPLAHAILERVRKSGYEIPTHDMTEVVVGRGVVTRVEDQLVRVGNKRFMLENDIGVEALELEIRTLENRGESIIYIAKDTHLIGVLGVHDALKENMKKSLNRLRFLGYDDIRLLTGDVEYHAEKMAVRMNMDDFESELMPEDKAKTVLQMQSAGSSVMMIGDGINDAPALAYADVGVAIGNTRTDIAIEAADVTVTNDDPLLIPSTVALSRKTMKIIKENFGLVIGINTIGIALSAMGWLPVFWASVLHNSSTIFVVMNSGRLLLHDFERRLT